MLLEYLCGRLSLLNPVPVSWAVGSGSQKGGGVGFLGGGGCRAQYTGGKNRCVVREAHCNPSCVSEPPGEHFKKFPGSPLLRNPLRGWCPVCVFLEGSERGSEAQLGAASLRQVQNFTAGRKK